MLVDFHMHSTVSDGTLHPKELVNALMAAQIRYASITDHDEVNAYHQLDSTSYDSLTLIKGCEFSTSYEGREVHVLGYAFDIDHPRILDYVWHYKAMRKQRVIQMIEKCQHEGYHISFEELVEAFPNTTSYGRPHIAHLLVRHGYVSTVKEAFKTVLSHRGSCFVPKERCHPKDAIQLIHETGGLAVLAHPKLVGNDTYVQELLDLPFDGVEVYHSSHQLEDIERYGQWAKEQGLLITGGSDFHGILGRYPEQLGIYEVRQEQVSDFIQAVITA